MSRISAGQLFQNPNMTDYDTEMWSKDKTSYLYKADIYVYFNILGVIYVLLHSLYLRRMLVQTTAELDKIEISPSDFGLIVRNIPPSVTKDSLKVQIEKQFNDEVKVVYVNLCYDISQMLELDKKVKDLSKQLGFYKLHLKREMKKRRITKKQIKEQPSLIAPPDFKTGLFSSEQLNLRKIDEELKATYKQMEEYGQNLHPGKNEQLFTGVAIAVVEKQSMQTLAIRKGRLQNACCGIGSSGANFTYERAPEPSDVYWENLKISATSRLLRVCGTYFATLIVIGACFGIIWAINDQQKKLAMDNKAAGGTVKFLSFLCSLVIIVTNISLRSVVRFFSILERHETYTAYNLSVAFKLAVVRFVNTAIVPTVVTSL